MLQLLFLVHAVIAVFLVFTRPLPQPDRVRLVRLAAGVGMLAAAFLFWTRGADAEWGAATLQPGSGAIAAAAIFCAWAVVAAGGGGPGRWDIGALVGAGSTAVALFATSQWIVPALLFWVVLSLATAAAVPPDRRSGGLWLSLALSDACFVGGWIAFFLETESWRLPEAVGGWVLVPLAAAVILRTGVLAGAGTWDLSDGPQMALLPLVIGSGFALVPAVSAGDEVWVALGLLLVAVGLAGWSIATQTVRVARAGTWITALMLAVTWIDPSVLARAGVAAVFGATVTVLWPATAGRAQAERGLLLAAVPLTVGFGVIVGGAAVSFERATVAPTVLASAPWSAFAALLPVALAAGVALGASVARRAEPELYEPAAVLATWGIAVSAIVLGLTPKAELGFGGPGPAATRGTWLYIAAAVLGVIAARFARSSWTVVMEPGQAAAAQAPPLGGSVARAVAVGAAVTALSVVVAAGWFTYDGLRNGFL